MLVHKANMVRTLTLVKHCKCTEWDHVSILTLASVFKVTFSIHTGKASVAIISWKGD